jgi:uncharacterized YigZ family protein
MHALYKTVTLKSEAIFKDKGSKFIGFCEPCNDLEEVKSILNQWKINHSQATHICYAYKIGVNEINFRANDDGEPSNSAGAPILGQINSFELTNVLVGVVRYYGGTNLGVGGLINAYKTAAKLAIEENEIVIEKLKAYLNFSFNSIVLPFVMNIIKINKFKIIEQNFQDNCKIIVEVLIDDLAFFKNQISQIKTVEIKSEIIQK